MELRHRHPFLAPHEDDGFIAFAHRGGSNHLPENSLAAFRAAANLGYRYLETDVQVTRDGVLVAFHDANLLRTCGVDRNIADMSSKDLADVRIHGREPIPFLGELFEEFPQAMFNVDAKSDRVVDPLIEFLRRTDSLSRVCVGSFDHHRLERIRSTFGERVCTSASPREVVLWMVGRMVTGPSCVQVPDRQSVVRVVTDRRVARSNEHGLPVHVWTIDDSVTMQRLIEAGVHGIMTDVGAVLREVVERNRGWT